MSCFRGKRVGRRSSSGSRGQKLLPRLARSLALLLAMGSAAAGSYDCALCDAPRSFVEARFLELRRDVGAAADNGRLLTGRARYGFHETHAGVLIHESCAERLGLERLALHVTASLSQGLQCLGDLGRHGALPEEHVPRLVSLFADGTAFLNRPKVVCNAPATLFRGAGGEFLMVASYRPEHYLRTSGPRGEEFVRHPFIALRPDADGSVLRREFRAALFHELFHNMGYGHGGGEEYAYACEAACFGGALDGRSHRLARRLCVAPVETEPGRHFRSRVASLLHAMGLPPGRAATVAAGLP